MSDQPAAKETQEVVRRWRPSWLLVVGICLILAAVGHYFRTAYRPALVPLIGNDPDPIEIAPDFQEVDTLAAGRGELAGCNVLLVTIDTTRADRLGCYGNEAIETPTLDSLARQGVIFSQATATAPTTLPSHSSILTGLYPQHHGVMANGLYRLADEHQTLAETLAENGYTTGAVVSAYVLDSRFGAGQGFASYDDDLSDCEEPPLFLYKERKAQPTTRRAIAWLRAAADDLFFLWVHYFDPHAIYEPPTPYAEQYESNRYDGEIAYVDNELGKLIAAVDELGLTDRTLVVAVGDHGDSLGQHNELTHAFLTYEATLRVPLIMRCGQRLGGGVHVSRRVSQVDIVPTIHSLLGLDPPQRTDGVDLTAEIPQSRPIFAETRHGMAIFGWAALLAVYQGAHKYIYGPEPELFDLSKDPNELKSLIDSRPDRAAALKEKLAGFFGTDLDMTEAAQPTEQLDYEALQKLEALGYVGVGATDIPVPSERLNPQDMMPALHVIERIMYTPDFMDDIEGKISQLTKVTEDFPNFHAGFRFLADLYRLTGQPDKAVKNYARALEMCRDPTTLYGIALANLALDKQAEAQRCLREIVTKYPDHLPAQYFLGMLAGQARDYTAAIEHFRYVFEVDPEFVQAGMQPCALQLLQAYALAGRTAELPGILQPKLEADPRLSNVRAALAGYHANQQEYAQAEALLREGVDITGEDPAVVTSLAKFLVGCPNPEFRRTYEGVAMMERLCERTGYQQPELLLSLSVVYSMARRMDEAIAVAQKVKAIAAKEGNPAAVQAAQRLLDQLRKAKATGETPAPPMPMGEQ